MSAPLSRREVIRLGLVSSALLAAVKPLRMLEVAEASFPTDDGGPFQAAELAMKRNGRDLKAVPTSCLQCVAICGVIGYADNGRIVKIEGNPHAPNNRGKICAKGQAGLNQVYDPDRILYPMKRVGKRGEGKWKRVSMDEALNEVAEKLRPIYNSEHPEEFMFHYGRSRFGYLVNHLTKEAFGTKTVGNHTSICEVGKWTAQEIVWGKHYDINDVEHSKFILNMGCNPLECHTSHSYFAQRVIDGVADGAKLVTVDVRLSNTAAKSDEWIPIRPGTDAALVLAMCHVIMNEGLYDEAFITNWTNVTVKELTDHLAPFTPEWASQETTVPADRIRRLAREFATTKPSTIITYRGYVGHYNGTHNEMAAKMLDAICGNLNVPGGTLVKVGGKWQDPYGSVRKAHKDAVRKPHGLKIIDGEDVALPTHHVNHRVFSMIKEGSHGRPKVYMIYTYNPVYVTGDCQENIATLKNESLIPYFVAVDTTMSESTELADLILPDATYLERWTAEAPQSYALIKFIQLRQPVTKPLGEAMDFQDIAIQLGRRIGGKMAELFPYDTTEAYMRDAVAETVAKAEKDGKTLYGVDGQPLSGDAFAYITKYGFILQSTKPAYRGHEKKVKEKDLKGTIVDAETGVVWNPHKAHVSDEDVNTKGYRNSKDAYKGYVGQMVGGVAYAGFKPDKLNKSGQIDLRSPLLKKAEAKLTEDLSPLFGRYPYLATHIKSGMPTYLPVPEHQRKGTDDLVMTSFKVNVQIHSRSANCKWLTEIYHNNPAWLNPATARRLGIKDGDLIRVTQSDANTHRTSQRTIETKVHLTEGIHPEVIAISFHMGRWAYGRYASGKVVFPERDDGESIWWQTGTRRYGPVWDEARGTHPNWIIPNAPDPISGQWRSNDTVVTIQKA